MRAVGRMNGQARLQGRSPAIGMRADVADGFGEHEIGHFVVPARVLRLGSSIRQGRDDTFAD